MNKIIDKRLYFNTLRQTRIFGILSLIASALLSLSYTVYIFSNTPKSQTYYANINEINILVCLSFVAIAPLLTVYAFRFTTTRAGSDFYFSIPKTRTQIFFSVYSSVFTWVLATLLIAHIIPLAFLFTDNIVLSLSALLLNFTKLLISCFMVMSAVSIAVGISGTSVFTVFFALIIIFVPRIFIMSVMFAARGSLPFVQNVSEITLLSQNATLPFGFVYNYFEFPEGITPIVYTLILGVVYLIIGYKLFLVRPSESATKPVTSKKMRALLRITVSSFINLILAYGICTVITAKRNINFEDIFVGIIVLIVSVGAYMLCELFTAKSAKAMVKVLPSYIIVIGITVAVCAVSSFVKLGYINYTPDISDIAYIRIADESEAYDYFAAKKSKIEFSDKELLTLVSDNLKENINGYIDHGEKWFYNSESKHSYRLSVEINNGTFTRLRTLFLTEEDYTTTCELMLKNKEYSEIYTDLPQNVLGVDCTSLDASPKQRKEIYNAFLKDIQSGNVTSKDVQDANNTYTDLQIDVTFFENNTSYVTHFDITAKFENALKAYLKVAENNGNAKKAKEIINAEYYEDLYFTNNTISNTQYSVMEKDYAKIREWLKKAKTENISTDDVIYSVTLLKSDHIPVYAFFGFDKDVATGFEKVISEVSEIS